MKRNLVTLVGVLVIVGGIVGVRAAFQQTIQTEAEAQRAAQAARQLAEAAEITEEAVAADADVEATASNVVEAATTDQAQGETTPAPAPTSLDGYEEIAWADVAPATFYVEFDTTAGPFVIQSHQNWAPLGHERFYELCKVGFFNDSGFFRVIHGFMVQFGLAADPKLTAQFKQKNLRDEPVRKSNQRGKVTFAKSSMPNSRTTQIFINYGDNSQLDADGFTPFAEVVVGMENVDKITNEYAERPQQGQITNVGTPYLKSNFPNLDMINKVTLVQPKP